MKKFKVVQKSTGEKVFEYFAEDVNAISGLGIPDSDLRHVELTDEQRDQETANAWYAEYAARVNEILKESDWSQLLDANITDEKKLAWKQYRADLRTSKGAAKLNPYFTIIPPKPEGL